MNWSRIRTSRLLLLAGTLLAFAGLVGYWLWPRPDTVELNTVQQALLGISEEDFHVSAIVAGRDILYAYSSASPVYSQSGDIICWRPDGTRSIAGVNTDTMIYASLRNDELTLISLPRDLFVNESSNRKLNTMIAAGPDALKNEVANILGVPVDHYVILNLEIFRNLVDALGGVEVDVPQRMRYYDCTGGLDIDLQPGLQRLDGKQASDFVRFRSMPRQDLDRLENLKQLAIAMLRRLQELHVTAVTRLPALTSTFLSDVETDVTPADVAALLPRVGSIRIGTIATLPTVDEFREGASGLGTDPAEVEWFLASVFGGHAREFADAPATELVVTDRSGDSEATDWYLNRLVALGVPEDRLVVRQAEPDKTPTRLVATLAGFEDAAYYAQLLNAGVQQVDRLGTIDGQVRQLELVLGEDALTRTVLRSPSAPGEPNMLPDTALRDAPVQN